MFAAGNNDSGRLGIAAQEYGQASFQNWNDTYPNITIKHIYCTYSNTIFVDDNDRYWVCGNKDVVN